MPVPPKNLMNVNPRLQEFPQGSQLVHLGGLQVEIVQTATQQRRQLAHLEGVPLPTRGKFSAAIHQMCGPQLIHHTSAEAGVQRKAESPGGHYHLWSLVRLLDEEGESGNVQLKMTLENFQGHIYRKLAPPDFVTGFPRHGSP
ncbi:hypothetical protein [Deinococcus marmoris]|uniref:hypothetical protein n=1 Tax=Deinococcus marmoris TaxID=249408 RepID=UPI0012DCAAEB|nr:hypothetical protein [Deinococcus marmoris]